MHAPNRRNETHDRGVSSHSRNARARSTVKHCRECGADVYANEKKCWNCGSKTTDRRVQCIIAWVLCAFFFLAFMGSDMDSSDTSLNQEVVTNSVTKPNPTPEPDIPLEYKQALEKAEIYMEFMAMSKQGIYDQLTSEYGDKFPPEAAQYAIDKLFD